MKFCKRSLLGALIIVSFAAMPVYSQGLLFDSDSVNTAKVAAGSQEVLVDALNAYRNEDWKTAIFLFKKFHSSPENLSPETLYMQIMAQTYSAQYKQASDDCDLFLKKYPHNQYVQLVSYQKGKNLYYTSDFERSIITLSDFCHTYPKHPLYASALFWIAECFYANYDFENAKPLYERIVAEYTEDSKAKDSQYRLDVIAQRSREEKLLFLLRQTGEDYLSSKETYEKELKQYQVESSVGVNSQLKELRQQNENLGTDLSNEKKRSAALEKQLKEYEGNLAKSVQLLKARAKEAQKLLDALEGK
ncbi:tetratricopeptide repeat protein [Treponema sp.]|uniref:tetratricopeptide repeat protein n=1 Tax=Treponema sp. TaxID=166 RepID=UPI00298E4E04|nr:tetratricopeptide repeat protein [Treponema sp.]MCR5613599.1 tetratricopeptide repeat protein [Treponema sp.]